MHSDATAEQREQQSYAALEGGGNGQQAAVEVFNAISAAVKYTAVEFTWRVGDGSA
jgi:hypothetical protein